MLEQIFFEKKLYAIIVRNKFSKNGANFLTERSLTQQVAHMSYPAGHKIKSHFHKKWVRKIASTMEALSVSTSVSLKSFTIYLQMSLSEIIPKALNIMNNGIGCFTRGTLTNNP